ATMHPANLAAVMSPDAIVDRDVAVDRCAGQRHPYAFAILGLDIGEPVCGAGVRFAGAEAVQLGELAGHAAHAIDRGPLEATRTSCAQSDAQALECRAQCLRSAAAPVLGRSELIIGFLCFLERDVLGARRLLQLPHDETDEHAAADQQRLPQAPRDDLIAA